MHKESHQKEMIKGGFCFIPGARLFGDYRISVVSFVV